MAIADAVSVGLLTCREGRICWANAALARAVGASSPGDLCGRSADSLLCDTGSGLPDWLAGELRAQPGEPLECGLRAGDGGTRAARVRALGAGAFEVCELEQRRGLEAENHRLAEALRAARAEVGRLAEALQESDRSRDELLTVVSHELQTPLTVVSGFVRLLLGEQAGPLTDEQRKFLSESARSCERLTRFVTHLVDAHPAAVKGRSVSPSDAPLAPTLQSVVDWLRPLAAERGQKIEVSLAPDASWACFDAPRAEQVLTNLLGNALKYGRPGGHVRVESRRLAAAGRSFVEVSVSDDGPGVPAADRERIFEPYVRGRSAPDGTGLGLGLAICRRIVASHGGVLGVDDAPGGGARFSFTLPLAEGR